MKISRKLAVILALSTTLLACSHGAMAVDLNQVQKELATTGAVGWVHGSVADRQLYAFTYRNSQNFFDYVVMSLVSQDPGITHQLAALTRHDKVRIKGSFMDNPSPQKHILVTSIETVAPYHSSYPVDPYDHQTRIPADLQGKDSGTFLVHAVAANGQILVAEYGDAIVPFFVKNGDLTKALFRGDLVQLQFKIQDWPDEPIHLDLNETAPQPVQVLDSIQSKNGKAGSVEGALILFPKSPEIKFNVFAVQELLPAGLSRQYTLVNFSDPNVFAQIRNKLQKAWDQYPNAYVNGRNKLVSTKLTVKATGIFNEVDPSQANPQILLKSADSVQIERQ